MNNWEEYAKAAMLCIKNNQPEIAKELLYKAINLNPNQSWPYYKLSELIDNIDEKINLVLESKNIEFSEWYYYTLIQLYEKKYHNIKQIINNLKKDFNEIDKTLITNDHILSYFEVNKEDTRLFKDISQYCSLDSIKHYENNLECICLLATGEQEITDNSYLNFLDQIDKNTNADLSKNIDLIIIANKKYDQQFYENNNGINNLKNKFKHLEIIYLDIPQDLDIYWGKNSDCDENVIPLYGYKSGPNYVFFAVMDLLRKYNSSLLLECDCYLSDKWLDRLVKYCSSQPFLISGSQYDGVSNESYSSLLNSHINGGTSIYATGNPLFQEYMQFCKSVMPEYIKYHSPDMPYDYLLKLVMHYHFDRESSKHNKILWNYIKKQYVYTTLIVNLSLNSEENRNMPITELKEKYNYAILHKK